MSENVPLADGEFSEWAQRVWETRRQRDPRNNEGPAAKDNGAGEKRIDVEGGATPDALEEAIKQRAIKWMEEGRFLVGLLQELLEENGQLSARLAALEEDVQRLREDKGGPQGERKEIVQIAPKGALDLASATQMKLQDYIDAGKTNLVLDLEGVDYIDSAGLGEIVRAMKRAREVGGDLRVSGLRGNVLRIFEITGLDKAFSLYPSREDAVASWG